ncbi:FkbH-like protein [Kitasatospora sp. MAA4]|uniref:HAD-IIIC family phosphatase n=1 Tax=Kitasatospora sp. MAA4 TaxID=3035093 RepID=UPI002475681B|nr:HAD-IIIC family phosphatase [Kitasatospora sp. MAA4]MDH6131737.1 FkbH-like protein [Kitasatospora sp. MAA4]
MPLTTTPQGALLDRVRQAARAGRLPDAGDLRALDDAADPAALRLVGRALAALGNRGEDDSAGALRPVRVGLLATSTPGPLEQLFRAVLVAAGMLPDIATGEYGQFEADLATTPERVFDGRDAVCCLLDDSWFLPKGWDGSSVPDLLSYVERRVEDLCDLVRAAADSGSSSLIVLHTVPLSTTVRDAVVSWRDRAGLSRTWYRLNAALLELAESPAVVVVDLVGLLADSAVPAADDRLRRYADIAYTDAALLLLAKEWRRVLQAKSGLSRKVLALDLDNTLWGGVLGEVGPTGVELGGLYPGNCYQELQRTALRLRNQGVILALASKNDEGPVMEALQEHPEVLLRPSTFSAQAVDWSPKAGNLSGMASQLGLATDAFVFMDDSPFECGHVAAELPDVAVVPAAGDPAELVRRLLGRGWFDVLELTDTDRQRPSLYQERGERRRFEAGFASSTAYLHGLEISADIRRVGPYDVQRVAQLAARTNQFNLTGVRFDALETARMAEDPGFLTLACSVADRFGDEGLVGALWVEKREDIWRVLNFVMSCRVLGRGVELAMLGRLAEFAREAGAALVEGEYVRLPRNGMAADLWVQAGFTPSAAEEDGTRLFRLAPENGSELIPQWIRIQERQR